MPTKTYRTFSSDQTKELGVKLAQAFKNRPSRRKGALVFALQGDLGAGKTTFVQGFFKGLGLKKHASSPTFIIMRRHVLGDSKHLSNLFHMDAYRLKKAKDLEVLNFKNILRDPKNILLIEWADRAKKLLPKDAVWIKFEHGKKENERTIKVR